MDMEKDGFSISKLQIRYDKRAKIIFDMDGLYGSLLYENDNIQFPRMADVDLKKIKGIYELTKVYYFEMRNSIAVINENVDEKSSEKQINDVKNIFDKTMNFARGLALSELISNRPINPVWLEYFNYLFEKQTPPAIKQQLSSVKFKVVHDGYLTSKINSENVIIVSSKIRAFLLVFNTVLLNCEMQIKTAMDVMKDIIPDENKRLFAIYHYLIFEPLFPYFLQPEFGLDLMRIPVVMAINDEVFKNAVEITGAQIEFILLHELGHAFHNHNNGAIAKSNISESEILELEFNADNFALSCLEFWPKDKIDFVYLGIEWLFSFLGCMDAVANRARELLKSGKIQRNNNYSDRLDSVHKIPVKTPWASSELRNRALAGVVVTKIFEEYLERINLEDIMNLIKFRQKLPTEDTLKEDLMTVETFFSHWPTPMLI